MTLAKGTSVGLLGGLYSETSSQRGPNDMDSQLPIQRPKEEISMTSKILGTVIRGPVTYVVAHDLSLVRNDV